MERHVVSPALGDRTISIDLPANYDIAHRRYPVLYLLDGDQQPLLDLAVAATRFDFQLDAVDHAIPPHLVVGIEQRDRGVEFGRSATVFLSMLIRDVVGPADHDFRTSPMRILVGHSLAGRFAIDALCRGGRLFTAAVAISPAIADSADLRDVIACLKERVRGDSGRLTQLFLSAGNRVKDGTEARFRPYQLGLRAWLADSAPPSLRWTFLDQPDVSHSQTPLVAIPEALAFVHASSVWELPPASADSLFAGRAPPDSILGRFYSTLEHRVGYPVPVDAKWQRIAAVLQARPGNWDSAIAAARRAIAEYPEDLEGYFVCADVEARSGDRAAAQRTLEAAQSIALRLAGSTSARASHIGQVQRKLRELGKADS